MHRNSLQAYRETRIRRRDRKHVIAAVLEVFGPLSDRKIAHYMGFADLNAVRPRITEMKNKRVLKEIGVEVDPITKRKVRVVALVSDNRCPEEVQIHMFHHEGAGV